MATAAAQIEVVEPATEQVIAELPPAGVEELGEGVAVSGNADDGVVEAIELPDRSFAVGVLWHPEEDERSRVVGSLVDEARDRMAAAAPRLREAQG